MESVKLDKMIINKNRIDYYYKVSSGLQKYFSREHHMFVEYDVNIEKVPQGILVIPFVANVLPLMWLTNATLWIKEIDRDYYESLFRVKRAYQEMRPGYILRGRIVAAYMTTNKYDIERKALELFSGGVDALTTYIRIKDLNPLLLNVYGLHNKRIVYSKVFEADKKNIRGFAEENKVECSFAQSNFCTCILQLVVNKNYEKKLGDTWWHGFQHGMMFIAIAIPLAFYYKAENIYIASSFSFEEFYSCASYPTVDNEVRFGNVGGVIHDGFELSRQDKVSLIVQFQRNISKEFPLQVCSFNDRNCCNCEKCFRTILELIAEGADVKNFGFLLKDSVLNEMKQFLYNNIKFYTKKNIYTWKTSISRIGSNYNNITEKELADWLLEYDFNREHRKALLKYRITQFLPIVRRRTKKKLLSLKEYFIERGKNFES